MEFGRLVLFLEFDPGRSLHEARAAFPLELQGEPFGRLLVGQPNLAGITAFHRRESYLQLRAVFVRPGRLEFFTAWYGLLQNRGIVQGLVNLCGRMCEIVCPFNDHKKTIRKLDMRSGRNFELSCVASQLLSRQERGLQAASA